MPEDPKDMKPLEPKKDDTSVKTAQENLKATEKSVSLQELSTKFGAKQAELTNKIAALQEAGEDKRASDLLSSLGDIGAIFERGPKSEAVMLKRLEDLDKIASNIESVENTLENQIADAIGSDEELQSLKALNDRMAQQNKIDSDILSAQEKIEQLQGFFGRTVTEESKALEASFETAIANLKEAQADGNAVAQALAEEQIQAILEGAESEEKRRENQKAQEEANSTLSRIASSSENMAGKFDDFASNVGGGAGFVGLLLGIGLATGVIDPEKFAETLQDVFEKIRAVIVGIIGIFKGTAGSVELITNNFGVFAAMLGTLALFLGGPLLRGLSALMQVAKVVRGFIMLQWVPGMIAMLSGMMSSFMAMLMNPVGLIVIGIAAAFAAVGVMLTKIRDALGFTSIMDVIMLGLAHVQDALAHFGNFFITIAQKIAGLASGVLEMFGFEVPDFITDLANAEMLSTDNASKRKEELLQKAEEAKAEQLEQEVQTLDPTTMDITQIPGISATDIETAQAQNFDLSQAQLGGQPISTVVQTNSNPVRNNSTVTNIVSSSTTDVQRQMSFYTVDPLRR